MAVRRFAPYGGPIKAPKYVFRSLRVFPDFFVQIEQIAAREVISVNALVNALLELALHLEETAEGQATIHEACTQWRTRFEYKMTAKREARS